MSDEEIKKEEERVMAVAKYLKDKAIHQLAQELKMEHGIPIDSETLEESFHRNGVNMRYLGEVYKRIVSSKDDPEKKEEKPATSFA